MCAKKERMYEMEDADVIDRKLAEAVFEGNVREVENLLRRGAYVDAVRWRDIDVFPSDQYRNVREADSVGGIHQQEVIFGRVIQDAYDNRDFIVLRLLLNAGADCRVNYVRIHNYTRFVAEHSIVLHAAKYCDRSMLFFFRDNIVDFNSHRSYDKNIGPLYSACKRGNADAIELLVDFFGADIDGQSGPASRKVTNVGASLHDKDSLLKLMHREVDINVFEGNEDLHFSVLYLAGRRFSASSSAVEAILAYNVDFDFHDIGDQVFALSPDIMDLVERKRHEQSVEYLRGLASEHIDDVDRWGKTALHRAAENGQLEQVRILLWRGALYNTRDHWGRRPEESAFNRYQKYAEKIEDNVRFSNHYDVPYRFARSELLTQQKLDSFTQINNYIRRFESMLGSPSPHPTLGA